MPRGMRLGVLCAGLLATVALTEGARSDETPRARGEGKNTKECGRFPPAPYLRPGQPAIVGTYRNRDLCYSVTVPAGLQGREGNPETARGLGIEVQPAPVGFVYVGGSANSLDATSADEQAATIAKWVKEDAAQVLAVNRTATSLGGLNASRVTVEYRCADDDTVYIRTAVIALSPQRSVVYEVDLSSRREQYKEHERVFERVRQTFQYTGARDQGCAR